MNYFTHKKLSSLLEAAMDDRKRIEPKSSFQALAESVGIQKSYLSKVLHGHAQLSGDQLFSIGRYFGWNKEVQNYAFLLLEHGRSGLEYRRQEILDEIERIRAEKSESSAHIEAKAPAITSEALQEFYLQPWLQLVHVALSVPRFTEALPQLATTLGIETQALREAVDTLVRIGLAEWKGKKILAKDSHLHLSRSSALFLAWRNQMRLHCLQRLQMAPKKKDYSFSVTFSAEESTRAWLHAEFLALLSRVETKVKNAESQEVYQMNFDLFGWSGT